MNLYIRYFNEEVIAHEIEEAVDFLKSLDIDNYSFDDDFVSDLQEYIDSEISYPKRYKIHAHVYFIVIKTTANTLEEFKFNSNNKQTAKNDDDSLFSKKKFKLSSLNDEVPGWYDGTLIFKRVIAIPGTNKFQYKDTRFRAVCKANSPQHCYERIVGFLKNRQDVDLRSQFPSSKGRNFIFSYVGEKRPVISELS